MEKHTLWEIERKILLPFNFRLLFKEGIPEGSNISLIGPPGIGKTIFCESLVNEYLRNKMNCVYVTIDRTPEEIKNVFNKKGINLYENKYKNKIFFVDGYTWLIGQSKEKYHIENLENLKTLQYKIYRAARELIKPIFLVFDSISPLSLYNPEPFVIKFFRIILAKVKEWKGLGIYVVQGGVHSEEFYNTLGYLGDGIFDMKMIEENGNLRRYFGIRYINSVAHEAKWIPFIIEDYRTIKF